MGHHPAQPVSKLVFDPAQAGVQQSGVGQNQGEQQAANLVKAVLYTHEVLGEVLNNLKQMPGGFLLLEQLAPERLDLGLIEEPHGSGGDGHGQGHGPQNPAPLSDGDHFVEGFLGERLAGEQQVGV
jgi:hypothetical protein